MEEKESPKLAVAGSNGVEAAVAKVKSKFSRVLDWMFSFTKFLLGVLLLPFVYSASLSFIREIQLVTAPAESYFWSGVISLIIIYLFVWEPAAIYTAGHKILEWVFSFFKPLVKVAPYLLPIYTIVLAVLYLVIASVNKTESLTNNFVFLFGFSLAMHLIFSAKTLRQKKGDFLKGNYIFGFSFVYITSILLLGFILGIIFDKFSFINLTNQTYQIAREIIIAVCRQLFSVKS